MTIESDIVAGDALLRLLRIDREWSPFVCCCWFFLLPLESCVATRPQRPGPEFVWVERYTMPAGVVFLPQTMQHPLVVDA